MFEDNLPSSILEMGMSGLSEDVLIGTGGGDLHCRHQSQGTLDWLEGAQLYIYQDVLLFSPT